MRRIVRWVLRGFAAVLIVLAIMLVIVYWRSESILSSRVEVSEPSLTISRADEAVARGQHLAITRGCGECHGADFGGHVVIDLLPVGTIAATNLTRGKGSGVADFSAADWERAIRHGVAPDGRMLIFMPIRDFAALTDTDMADMIAYLSQLQPVDRELPAVSVGPILRLQMLLGAIPLAEARVVDQHRAHVASIDEMPTADFGRYLATTCTGCHGEHFSGGPMPGVPPGFPVPRNITPDPASGLGRWSKADFDAAMRTGKRPDGTSLDPFMPWASFAKLSQTELDALWAYLQSLPARPAGQR